MFLFFSRGGKLAEGSCFGDFLGRLVLALTAVVAVATIFAHSLDVRSTSVRFSKEFIEIMAARASAGDTPLVKVGDEFWVVVKATPGPGTATGIGGCHTFYLPPGVQLLDAQYVVPDAANPGEFIPVPLKGQAPISLGDGIVGAKSSPGLVGLTLPGVNGLGENTAPLTATGLHRGTLAGVYGDTGIFYSTDPRTAFNSYGAAPAGGTAPLVNSSGDTVGEWDAANVAGTDVLGVTTLWDSYQLRGYGQKDDAVIDSPDQLGNAPWGLASPVAGPESGYAWEFDYATYLATAGTELAKVQAAISIGPWQRIKYPGSQIASDLDYAGSDSDEMGFSSVDASGMGRDLATNPLPATVSTSDATSPKAVRFSVGGLLFGRPEFIRVKIRVNSLPETSDWVLRADAFGGDAGGELNGRDHLWRYFDPTSTSLRSSILLQKVASTPIVVPGQTFHFDIIFANNSNLPLPDVTLTDTLPSGVSFVSAVPAADSGPSPLVWDLGTVAPGELHRIRVNVQAIGSGTLLNNVLAKSGPDTLVSANDTVESGEVALLRHAQSVSPSSVGPGEFVQYTLTVYNDGAGTASVPIVLQELLPEGFTYQSVIDKTINDGILSDSLFWVDASDSSSPVFTVSQGIEEGGKLTLTIRVEVAEGVSSGVYYNSFTVQHDGTILGPVPASPVTVGAGKIGNRIWRDWDGDGVQDAEEEGIAGVTVELYEDDDGYAAVVATVTTDNDGIYEFDGLSPNGYRVLIPTPPANTIASHDPDGGTADQADVVLGFNEGTSDVDFGYQPSGTAVIRGNLYQDNNATNSYETGLDIDIDDVTVNLYEDSNGNGVIEAGDLLLATAVSDGTGEYIFPNLPPALDYIVDVETADSDLADHFSPNTYHSVSGTDAVEPRPVEALAVGTTIENFGFLSVFPASIGDQVFFDANGDDSYTPGTDVPLANVTISLYLDGDGDRIADAEELVGTTSSDASGFYKFTGLSTDDYLVVVDEEDPQVPAGTVASTEEVAVTLASGQEFLEADFPFVEIFSKSVDKTSAIVGDMINYTIVLDLPGDSLYSDLLVCDPIPGSDVAFVSASAGGVYDAVSDTVCWDLGSHVPGRPGISIVGSKLFAFRGGETPTFWSFNSALGVWSVAPDFPIDRVQEGGALTTDGTYVYAMSGRGKRYFQRYDPVGDSWFALADTPDNIKSGGALVYHSATGTIFALRGDREKNFYEYTIGTNTWERKENIPDNVDEGGALVSDGIFVYAFRGDKQRSFYRYITGTDSWERLADAPAEVDEGAALTYAGGYIYAFRGKSDVFWRYDPLSDTWIELATTPARVGQGGALATVGTTIYALRGDNKNDFWRYSILDDAWIVDEPAPETVRWGGALVSLGTGQQYDTRLDSDPAIVADGATVTIEFAVRASEDITGFTPPPTLIASPSGGAAATYVSGPFPAGPVDFAAGEIQFFTYTYTVSAGTPPCSTTFSSGVFSSGGVTWPAASSHSTIIVPELTMQVEVLAATAPSVDNHALFSGTAKHEPNYCYVLGNTSGGGSDADVLLIIEEDGRVTRVGITGTSHAASLAVTADYSTLYTTDLSPGELEGSDRFGTLDVFTGIFSPIGELADGFNPLEGALGAFAKIDVQGMAFDPITGDLYAVHRRESAVVGNTLVDVLFKIDVTAGQHVEDAFGQGVDYVVLDTSGLGLYDVSSLAFHPTTGVLYAVASDTTTGVGDGDRLVTIDTDTGTVSDIARIQRSTDNADIDDVEGLTFSAEGTLHAVTGDDSAAGILNSYWLLDPDTAKASLTGYASMNPITDPEGAVTDFRGISCFNDDIALTADDDATTALSGSIGDLVWADINGDGDLDPTFSVFAGRIDFDTSGGVDANDAGLFGSVWVIDGYLDLDGDGNIDADDAGVFQGYDVIAGALDVVADGGIDGSDNGVVIAEAGIANVQVFADLDGDGQLDWIDGNADAEWDPGEGEQWGMTDARGSYNLYGFTAGTYTITYDPATVPTGYTPTTSVTVAAALATNTDQYSNADFGFRPPLPSASDSTIGNLVWIDRNEDGLYDAGEDEPVAGVTVSLYRDEGIVGSLDAADVLLTSQVTDSAGNYLFTGLYAGNYLVLVDEGDPDFPGGATLVAASPAQPNPEAVSLGASEDNATVDFAYNYTGTIGDFVWYDTNADGVYDSGSENGVNAAEVLLYLDEDGDGLYSALSDSQAGTVYTDAAGAYLFENLAPGTYFVMVYSQSVPVPSNPAGPRTMQTTTDSLVTVVLGAGGAYVDADFGFANGARIEGVVFYDSNHNGVYDCDCIASVEGGLPGVTVWVDANADGVLDWVDGDGDNLWDPGEGEQWASTDADGEYGFFVGTLDDYVIRYDTADPDLPPNLLGAGVATTPVAQSVTVDDLGEVVSGINFGRDDAGVIGNLVFWDQGVTGTYEGPVTDPGLPNVVLELYRDGGDGLFNPFADSYIAATITDSDGYYQFPGLPPGTYFVDVYEPTLSLALATDPSFESAPYLPLDGLATIVLGAAGSVQDVDFGYALTFPGSISGTVFDDGGPAEPGDGSLLVDVAGGLLDLNRDGIVDANDNGFFQGYAVVAGLLDIDDDGTAGSPADDLSSLLGFPVIDGRVDIERDGTADGAGCIGFPVITGRLDLNQDGSVDATDNGVFHEYAVIGGYIDVDGDGVIETNGDDDLADLAGYPVINGFFDVNGNGTTGEVVDVAGVARDTGVAGIVVNLYDSREIFIATTLTDSDGFYQFFGLRPGTYTVEEIDPRGAVSVTDKDGDTSLPGMNLITVDVTAGTLAMGNDFLDDSILLADLAGQVRHDTDVDGDLTDADVGIGNVDIRLFADLNGDGLTPLLDIIGGAVDLDGSGTIDAADVGLLFGYGLVAGEVDFNGNGVIDAGDNGMINGVVVTGGALIGSDTIGTETLIATTTTDGNGDYLFHNLTFANYSVVASDPALSTSTADADGENDNQIGALVSFGGSAGNDFLDSLNGTISGHLYSDTNGNGTQDGGEPDLVGIDVVVEDFSGAVQTVSTDAGGDWVASVPPGQTSANVAESDSDFLVAFPDGYVQTEGTDSTTVIVVASVNTATDNDGYFNPAGSASLAGTVYNDSGSGDFTGVDLPVPGVVIHLYLDVDGDHLVPFYDVVDGGLDLNGGGVDGTDNGSFFDYVVIGGFFDINNDGAITATDNGMVNGIPVLAGRLDVDGDGNSAVPDADDDATLAGEPLVASTATSAAGTYSFDSFAAASYVAVEVDPSGAVSLADRAAGTEFPGIGTDNQIGVVLGAIEASGGNDFLDQAAFVYSIAGTVYRDADHTATFSSGDEAVSGVTVSIYVDIDGDAFLSASELSSGALYTETTDINGDYVFVGLPNGNYIVVETDPVGYSSVTDTDGNTLNGANRIGVTISGADVTERNFLDVDYVLPPGFGLVQGTIYIDENGDGLYDAGDTPLPNLDVLITKSDGSAITVTTGADGYFQAIVPVGLTVVDIDHTDPDVPSDLILTTDIHGEGSDPTRVTVPERGVATDNTGTVYAATPAFGVKTSCRTPESGGVLIAWSAQVELGVLKYLVQVSAGDSWTTLGSVFSRTEGLRGGSYEYLDRLALPGEPRTYRLLCVDVDGRSREHGVGSATATAIAPAAATTAARSGMPIFPDDGVFSVETLEYDVQRHATDTPAMLGSARRAEVSAGGLYATGGTAHVYNAGRELPDLGDGLVYVRPYSDPYTDTNVVWGADKALQIIGAPGTVPAPPVQGRLGSDGYTAIVHVERDEMLALNSMLPPGPNWFYGYSNRLAPGNTPILRPDVPSPASAGTVLVLVAMRSTTGGDHDLGLVVNDIPVALAAWSGKGHHLARFEFELADCPLRDGDNQIQLWTSAVGSSKRLDYVEIHTPATPVLRDGALVVEVAAAVDLAVPGATHAIDITEFGNEAALPIEGGVVASLQGGRTVYFTAGVGSLDWSAAKNLSAVDTALAGKQYVAVAPETWLPALAPLVATHEAKGLSSIAVAAEDVYDTYGGGFPTPAGLIRFGLRVQPEYLLIGAGASHDPKGLQGDLPPAGIPTGFVHVYEGTASTDDLYGNDLSIAVGRLPARTVGELANMVNKIVDFHPGRRAVMMADVDDATMSYGDFAALQAELAEKLPSVLLDANTMDGSAMRAALVENIRNGANLVTYQGHGNNALIGDAYDILNTSHVDRIPPSAWLLSTCLTGAYTLEDGETKVLASELLRTPGNGAVCVLASTCFGQAGSEHRIVEEAVRRIATGGATWGDILSGVKLILRETQTASIYTLLGDPAMRTLNPVPGDREIIIVSPVAGGFVNGAQAPEVRFSLRGEWWRETLEILWRRSYGEWVPLKELTIDPEIFDYTIPWNPPPEDGTDYQIMIRDISAAGRVEE